MADTDQVFMTEALLLAESAAQQGEVPIGAIVVRDGEVIGRGWNQNIGLHDPSAHAEIMAMRDAGQKLGNHRLPGCSLYVTLEPLPLLTPRQVRQVDVLICWAILPTTMKFRLMVVVVPGKALSC